MTNSQLNEKIKRYREHAEKYEADVEFAIKFMLQETNSIQQIQKIFRKYSGWLNNEHQTDKKDGKSKVKMFVVE